MTVGSMQDTPVYSPPLPPWDRAFAQNNLQWQNQFQPIPVQTQSCDDQITLLKNHLQQQVSNAQNNETQKVNELHSIQEISRRTPEILEPRKSINEPEHILKKKVTPFKYNGIVAELPSIDTFCKYQAYKRKGSVLKKGNGKLKKKITNTPGPTSCGCTTLDQENSNGPFYTHLGSGKTQEDLLHKLAKQFDVSKESIKINMVQHTTTEGKNGDGCPLAKWVVRRTGPQEKYMALAKYNKGHFCDGTVSVIALVAWEGISKKYADELYQYVTENLNECGLYTRRRCGANESKTCMCQGQNEETNGASFTFGCSWLLYYDGCKFAKSKVSRKFRMQDPVKEQQIEKVLQDMASNVSPLLNIWAPKAFENMTRFEDVASDCRIGANKGGRPFSGVTCCLDFCTHSHKDLHNMANGTTMVCTLLRPDSEREDEQFHVLPFYQLIDDHGQIAPANFQIPSHFLNSKLQERKEPKEGKGKYVCPVKVTANKEEVQETLVGEPTVTFSNETSLPQVKMQRNPWNLPATFPGQDLGQENNQIPMHPMFLPDNSAVEMFKNHESLTTKMEPLVHSAPQNKVLNSKETIITPGMGGVSIALDHGSFLIECAKKEVHATTSLKNPRRDRPSRLSMVFYQHKKLNQASHGVKEYKEKMEKRKLDKQREKQSFDDLALLATTASLNDSNIPLDRTKSCDNTPEKRNPLLELCLLESISEPNLPSLFPDQQEQDIRPLPPTHVRHSYINGHMDSKVNDRSPDVNKFSIDTLMNDVKPSPNDIKTSQTKNTIVHPLKPNNMHATQLKSEAQTSKLPTFSIFAKRLPVSEPEQNISNIVNKGDTDIQSKSDIDIKTEPELDIAHDHARRQSDDYPLNHMHANNVTRVSDHQQNGVHSNNNKISVVSSTHSSNVEKFPTTIPAKIPCELEDVKFSSPMNMHQHSTFEQPTGSHIQNMGMIANPNVSNSVIKETIKKEYFSDDFQQTHANASHNLTNHLQGNSPHQVGHHEVHYHQLQQEQHRLQQQLQQHQEQQDFMRHQHREQERLLQQEQEQTYHLQQQQQQQLRQEQEKVLQQQQQRQFQQQQQQQRMQQQEQEQQYRQQHHQQLDHQRCRNQGPQHSQRPPTVNTSANANTSSKPNLQHPRHLLMQSLQKAERGPSIPHREPNLIENGQTHRRNDILSYQEAMNKNSHELETRKNSFHPEILHQKDFQPHPNHSSQANGVHPFAEMANISRTSSLDSRNSCESASTSRNNSHDTPPTPGYPPISEWQKFHANLLQHVNNQQVAMHADLQNAHQYKNSPSHHQHASESHLQQYAELEAHRNQVLLQKMAQMEQFKRGLQPQGSGNNFEGNMEEDYRRPTLLDQHAAMWRHQYISNPESEKFPQNS